MALGLEIGCRVYLQQGDSQRAHVLALRQPEGVVLVQLRRGRSTVLACARNRIDRIGRPTSEVIISCITIPSRRKCGIVYPACHGGRLRCSPVGLYGWEVKPGLRFWAGQQKAASLSETQA